MSETLPPDVQNIASVMQKAIEQGYPRKKVRGFYTTVNSDGKNVLVMATDFSGDGFPSVLFEADLNAVTHIVDEFRKPNTSST